MAQQLSPAEFQRQQVAAATQLARFSWPELWFQQQTAITSTGGSTIVSPGIPLNLTRPIESLTLLLSFRVTVSVAPFTAVAPEAPQNFLQRIQLQGNHKDYGGITPFNVTGATTYALGRQFQLETGGGNYLISKNGGALTRANQPGRPFVSSFDGAVGTHDIIVAYHVPFGPSLAPGQAVRKQSTNYLLQPLDWGNTLQLQAFLGDATSFGDNTGATTVFAGFGGTGNPNLQVFANYSLLGTFQNKMQRSGVIMRNEQQLNNQTATGTAVLLSQLAHQITTSILLKSGSIQTVLSAGVDTLASLSDLMLEATQLQVDNKALRNNISNFTQKAYAERMFNTISPSGYFPISFVDGGGSLLAYRGDKLPGGSQWNLVSNVITAGAAQRLRMLQEYCLGGPFPA